MTFVAWLAGAWLIYAALILRAVYCRGAFQIVYNPVVAWILRVVGGGNILLCTVGARSYQCARFVTPIDVAIHERFHYEQQWRVYPLTFLPRYFVLLAVHGYGCHPMEEAARKAAGEPSECVK